VDLGLFLIRAVVGLLFVGHGTQKLFGWFDGHGMDGTAGFFESLGYRNGRSHAQLAGASEAIGGALLFLGLLTPFAAAAIIGVMLNAVGSVHIDNGVWNTEGGYEYNLVNGTVAAGLAFAGPGDFSFDNALGLNLDGFLWGLVALALGGITGFLVLSAREVPEEKEEEARRVA
jgi:putative oxidoreductase